MYRVEYAVKFAGEQAELHINKKLMSQSGDAVPIEKQCLLLYGKGFGRSTEEEKCTLLQCELCSKGSLSLAHLGVRKAHGWKQRLVLSFSVIKKSTKKSWFSLTKDIYPFFEAHWSILWPDVKKDLYINWRKKLQDSLSHNKDIFESGAFHFGKKGYWRLIETPQILLTKQLDTTSKMDIDSPLEVIANCATQEVEQQDTKKRKQSPCQMAISYLVSKPKDCPSQDAATSCCKDSSDSRSIGQAAPWNSPQDFSTYLQRHGIFKMLN